MKLVKFENYKLVISEEALFIKSFANIWKRDRSAGKEKALSELGFIYFQYDPRSDYMYITNEEDRAARIKLQEGMDANWQPDKLVLAAIEDYKSLMVTTGSLLLDDTRMAINEVRRFLRNLDLDKTDDKGKPMYTINTITSTIEKLPKLVKDLAEAQREVDREIMEAGLMRGKKTKKLYEDEL